MVLLELFSISSRFGTQRRNKPIFLPNLLIESGRSRIVPLLWTVYLKQDHLLADQDEKLHKQLKQEMG